MSATLNMNPIPIVQWKGKTFTQVHSFIKRNDTSTINRSNKSLFLANPLRHYRREIASVKVGSCNPRTSHSIDVMNRPSSSIMKETSSGTLENGLATNDELAVTLPKNKCETYDGVTSGSCSVILSPADNARRRLRGSGVKRVFDETTSNRIYYSDHKQYLNSRSKTFEQNQYNYMRSGDATSKPGSADAQNNGYSAQGIKKCTNYYKPNNYQFAVQGAVSSGDLITRKKYNTITNNTEAYRKAFGTSVANALAYGVPPNGYTLKERMGYPLKRTPTFRPESDEMRKCTVTTIANMI